MNVCGLWQGSHRLAAVIANDDGTLRPPITTPATPDHTRHLLDYLVTAGIDTRSRVQSKPEATENPDLPIYLLPYK